MRGGYILFGAAQAVGLAGVARASQRARELGDCGATFCLLALIGNGFEGNLEMVPRMFLLVLALTGARSGCVMATTVPAAMPQCAAVCTPHEASPLDDVGRAATRISHCVALDAAWPAGAAGDPPSSMLGSGR